MGRATVRLRPGRSGGVLCGSALAEPSDSAPVTVLCGRSRDLSRLRQPGGAKLAPVLDLAARAWNPVRRGVRVSPLPARRGGGEARFHAVFPGLVGERQK